MRADKRLAVSQIAGLGRMRIHRKHSVDLFKTLLQAKMKSLLLLLLVAFTKASLNFEGNLSLNNTNSTRSCLDYLKRGYLKNGFYLLYDDDGQLYTVVCDFSSEPGSAWTLVVSWVTAAYKDLIYFKYRAFNQDSPINENNPNFYIYRQTLDRMISIRDRSTHWRATCSFEQTALDYKDYIRGKFSEFDIIRNYDGGPSCYPVEYVNILGNVAGSNNTAGFWQIPDTYFLHIDSSVSNCDFLPLAEPVVDYFGYYGDGLSTEFRCSRSEYATTQWWFGGYLE